MAEQDPKGQAGEAGAQGAPDHEQQIERQKAEIATLKAEKETLTQQLADEKAARESLDKQLESALTEEDVKAAVEKARADAKEEADKAEQGWKAREKRLTVENALIAAGCIDAKAAMAHVDLDKVDIASDGHISGLDIKELSDGHSYLFNANNAGVSSAADPGGAPKKAKTRKEIAEIEDPMERRKLIEESLEASEN